MSDFKENWANYNPPLIPIYFISKEALEELLDREDSETPKLPNSTLELLLGYYEEYEMYEMAQIVANEMSAREIFGDLGLDTKEESIEYIDDSGAPYPPPDDGQDWTWVPGMNQWTRIATPEEVKKFMSDYKGDEDDDDEDDTDNNPYKKPNPFK